VSAGKKMEGAKTESKVRHSQLLINSSTDISTADQLTANNNAQQQLIRQQDSTFINSS